MFSIKRSMYVVLAASLLAGTTSALAAVAAQSPSATHIAYADPRGGHEGDRGADKSKGDKGDRGDQGDKGDGNKPPAA